MISTENVSPSTSLTVSETPSSATEPLGAMNRDSAAGARNVNRAMSGKSSRADEIGNAVDMAADQMAAELVAKPQRALEIELGAALPGAGRGHAQGLRGDVDGEEGAIAPPSPLDDRQAGAGTGDRSADLDGVGIVAAGDGQAAQPVGLLIDLKNFA